MAVESALGVSAEDLLKVGRKGLGFRVNIEALIIRIGFSGILYCKYSKEPPK